MFSNLFSRESRRRRILSRAPDSPLRDYLAHPFPDRRQACADTRFLALDLETTGLKPGKDRILSVGTVAIEDMRVCLSSSWHTIVRNEDGIPHDSAVVHGITDDVAARGESLSSVLGTLLSRMSGAVILVHYSNLEQGMLDAACRVLYRAGFVCPMIDTLALGQRALKRAGLPHRARELRLSNLRARFNLPPHDLHSALGDALATAELFLALRAELDPGERLPVGHFMLR